MEQRRREAAVRAVPARLAALLPRSAFEVRSTGLHYAAEANQVFLSRVADAQSEAPAGAAGAAGAPRSAPALAWQGAPRSPHASAAEGAAAAAAAAAAQARFERGVDERAATHHGKVQSTLRQVARDWSSEGAAERANTYGAVQRELQRLLPTGPALGGARGARGARDAPRPRVLVPGCGLGRLPFELALAGYEAQGCEFSYFMLFAANVLLNETRRAGAFTLYPWLHDASNHWSAQHMLRAVSVPDVDPRSLLEQCPDARLSMAGGEFLEVYSEPAQAGAWDAVATVFFLDTAPNPLEYVDRIFELLRPGGVWVNAGPLLYHWQAVARAERAERAASSEGEAEPDDRFSRSLELTYEELRFAIERRGFEFVSEARCESGYAGDSHSMMRTAYNCAHFTAVKPLLYRPVSVAAPPAAAGTSACAPSSPNHKNQRLVSVSGAPGTAGPPAAHAT